MKNITVIFAVLVFSVSQLFSQIKGEEPPVFNPDTIFVFNSPRPLINPEFSGNTLKKAWGIDLLFSGSGFGVGGFYNVNLSDDLIFITSLYISGARNSDEFDNYVWDEIDRVWRLVVPDKVNRLFVLPLTFGLQYYLFSEKLSESFKPYINIGVGPSLIISTPYSKEFFSSWGYAESYIRWGGFLGAGAYFSANSKTLMGINARYYFIPFGGKGLESLKERPINDFGGLFLSLSLGLRF